MSKIDNIIKEEVIKFSSPLTPEALQLLLYNVAMNSATFFVTAALEAAHNEHQLPIEDLEFTLNSYPLTNIK